MAERIVELAAGTYDIRGDATSQVAVPTLTAGTIDQSSPSIGDTLTVAGSNVSGGATTAYQWQQSADGSTGWANIGGAISASLDTSSGVTDDYYVRRGVSDGVQGLVYTAAVQVEAAAATLSATLQQQTSETHGAATTLNVSIDIGSADSGLEIYCFVVSQDRTATAATIDGVTATVTSTTNDSSGMSMIRAALPSSSGTVTLALTFGAATIADVFVSVFRVLGKTSEVEPWAYGRQTTTQANDFAVLDGDVLIGAFAEDGAGGLSYSGMTRVGTAAIMYSSDIYEAAQEDIAADNGTYTVTHSRTAGGISAAVIHLR